MKQKATKEAVMRSIGLAFQGSLNLLAVSAIAPHTDIGLDGEVTLLRVQGLTLQQQQAGRQGVERRDWRTRRGSRPATRQ